MTRTIAFLVLLLTTACGEPAGPQAIRYGLGDPAKAIARTEPPPPSAVPAKKRKVRDLLENETVHFDASIHMLLELRPDGGFTYWGPPSMGADEARIEGQWKRDGDRVLLMPVPAFPAKEGLVDLLACPIQGDVVEFPLGRDLKNPVFYGLRDLRIGAFRNPVIRIGR